MDAKLSLAELNIIKAAIEVACSRGAFQAGEMRPIGEAYDKLAAFIQTVTEPQVEDTQGDKND